MAGCEDAEKGDIVAIELYGNRLFGSIPPELFTFFPNILSINLASNELNGPIPREVGMLKNVGILELAENQLTSQIPSELGMLEKADHIFLQSNRLVGPMPAEVCALRANKSLTLLWADCQGDPPRVQCSLTCCSTCFLSSGEIGDDTTSTGSNEEEQVPASHADSGGYILATLKKMAPDGGVTLEDTLSPQYKAYSWLVESNYQSLSDILTLQRYALATLYFRYVLRFIVNDCVDNMVLII